MEIFTRFALSINFFFLMLQERFLEFFFEIYRLFAAEEREIISFVPTEKFFESSFALHSIPKFLFSYVTSQYSPFSSFRIFTRSKNRIRRGLVPFSRFSQKGRMKLARNSPIFSKNLPVSTLIERDIFNSDGTERVTSNGTSNSPSR